MKGGAAAHSHGLAQQIEESLGVGLHLARIRVAGCLLAQAERTVEEQGLRRHVELQQMDAESLGFADASFDCVLDCAFDCALNRASAGLQVPGEGMDCPGSKCQRVCAKCSLCVLLSPSS